MFKFHGESFIIKYVYHTNNLQNLTCNWPPIKLLFVQTFPWFSCSCFPLPLQPLLVLTNLICIPSNSTYSLCLSEMESAPRNVQVRPLSSSTMVITWEPPETPNGQVTVSTWHQVRILNNKPYTDRGIQRERGVKHSFPRLLGARPRVDTLSMGTAEGSWLENGQMTFVGKGQEAEGRRQAREAVETFKCKCANEIKATQP